MRAESSRIDTAKWTDESYEREEGCALASHKRRKRRFDIIAGLFDEPICKPDEFHHHACISRFSDYRSWRRSVRPAEAMPTCRMQLRATVSLTVRLDFVASHRSLSVDDSPDLALHKSKTDQTRHIPDFARTYKSSLIQATIPIFTGRLDIHLASTSLNQDRIESKLIYTAPHRSNGLQACRVHVLFPEPN